MMALPVLSYGLAPNTVPITLSDLNPSEVSLQLTAKNDSSGPVSIQKIVITLGDLCDSYGGVVSEIIGPASSTWSIASPLNDGVFTLLSKSDGEVTFQPGDQLVIELKNFVAGRNLGVATVRFEETSGMGTGATTEGVQKVRPPLSASLSVSPESGIVAWGGMATLQWRTVGATSGRLYWAEQPDGMPIEKPRLPRGQYTVTSILHDTTFRLVCQGQETEPDVIEEFSVCLPSPKITAFYPEPEAVDVIGGPASATLSWNIELPPGMIYDDYLQDVVIDHDVGSVKGKTSIPIDVKEPVTYTLTATDWTGRKSTCRVGVCTLRVYALPAEPIAAVVRPDGSLLYLVNRNEIRVIDLAQGLAQGLSNPREIVAAASSDHAKEPFGPPLVISADGSRLYVTAWPWRDDYYSPQAPKMLVYDISDKYHTGGPTTVLQGAGCTAACISPALPRLYAFQRWDRNDGGSLTVIDTQNPNVLRYNEIHGFFPLDLAVSPDGSCLYAALDKENCVSVRDAKQDSLPEVTRIQVGRNPTGLAINPGGTRLYVTNRDDGNVSVVDMNTKKELYKVPVGQQPKAVAVRSDGSRVYVANAGDKTLSVIDATHEPNAPRAPVALGRQVSSLCFHPDGTRMYLVCPGNKPELIEMPLYVTNH